MAILGTLKGLAVKSATKAVELVKNNPIAAGITAGTLVTGVVLTTVAMKTNKKLVNSLNEVTDKLGEYIEDSKKLRAELEEMKKGIETEKPNEKTENTNSGTEKKKNKSSKKNNIHKSDDSEKLSDSDNK